MALTVRQLMRHRLAMLRTALQRFSKHRAMQMAAAMAFYAMLAIAPMVVIIVAAAGFVWGQQAVRGELAAQIEAAVGREAAEQLQTAVAAASDVGAGTVAMALGTLVLIIAATGFFIQLRTSLNTVWEVARDPDEGGIGASVKQMLRDRLIALAVVIGLAALLLLALVAGTIIAALGDALPAPPAAMLALDIGVSFLVLTLAFAALFRFVPDVRVHTGFVLGGAAMTATLFIVGKLAIGLYLGQASVATAHGAAGSLVILLLWVYYSSMIVLFGAELTRANAERRGAHIEPKPHHVHAPVPAPTPGTSPDRWGATHGNGRPEDSQRRETTEARH